MANPITHLSRNAAASNALIGIWKIVLSASIILALYFGQSVMIPAALAALLAFVLSPLVTRIERWTGRIAAILIVVALVCTILGGTGWILARQLVDVGTKLPDYRVNIESKVRAFRLPAGGAASRLLQMFKELKKEVPGATMVTPDAGPSVGGKTKPAPKTASDNLTAPTPVEIVQTPENGAIQLTQRAIVFFLGPLGKAALVLLLLIFILMQREDLLGRLIRLSGQGNISSTTLAMGDAGARLARYLRLQLLVNITYGACVAVGLYFLGIPNAILCGGLAGVLRFIPYVGPWLGAAPPIILSLAISPSWLTPLLVFGFFAILELINSNAVEPWLYGAVTGVTPLALVAGAIFWTWIWGPIGLLLTTPLMVCLVVLGRHVPHVAFLSVLLSDERALTPPEECYHRFLAYEPDEASLFVDTYLETNSLAALYNDVLIRVLTMAEMDFRRGLLYEGQRDAIFQGIREIVDDIREHPASRGAGQSGEETNKPTICMSPTRSICCLPARTERDELSGMMLAQLLDSQDFDVKVVSLNVGSDELINSLAETKTDAVCLSVVMPSTVIHARRLIMKLRARFPNMILVVGLWGVTRKEVDEEQMRASGANGIAFTLMEAVEMITARVVR